jgi:O-antigen ligase
MIAAAARAGWVLAAVLFATILSSFVHVDHVGVAAELLLLAIAAAAALRPDLAIAVAVAVVPLAWYLASHLWANNVNWAEAVACATLAGLSLHAAIAKRPAAGLPLTIAAPAILFGAIVVSSIVASLAARSLPLGPAFNHALAVQLTREYFVNVRGFSELHAGMLLLEGLLLFSLAARVALERADADGFLRRVIAGAAAAGGIAAIPNVVRLVRSAARSDAFWTSLNELVTTQRFNVHYADVNAAGSYFVLVGLLALALAVTRVGARRAAWVLCAVTSGIGLWLTSSRVGILAGLVTTGAVLIVRGLKPGRGRLLRAAGIAAAGIAVLALVAIALPRRGTQQSSVLAADVRLGMLQTGARMIARQPIFGLGLGQFHERSGEFSSPELIAKFPVAVHENAHNNVLQVAAELGIAAGVLFAWIIAASLVWIGRGAARAPDAFLWLVLAGTGAFALSALGGHPLLIPEAGYVFWTVLGAAAGVTARTPRPRVTSHWLVPAGLAIVVLALPWQMKAVMADADLEHVGIDVSRTWQLSPDGIKYRAATGHATLFIPAEGAKVSVFIQSDAPQRLELKLDGRVANVLTLAPRRWNDLLVPGRHEISNARYAALDLRILDSDQTVIWITKDQPLK